MLKISLSPKILLRFYIQFLFSAQYSIPIFTTSIFIFIGKLSSTISCNLDMICKDISKLFKACVYFLANFYFSLSDSPSKTVKNIFLFYLKSSFHSRDIQIFVFNLPLFFPLSVITLEVHPRKTLKFMKSSTV